GRWSSGSSRRTPASPSRPLPPKPCPAQPRSCSSPTASGSRTPWATRAALRARRSWTRCSRSWPQRAPCARPARMPSTTAPRAADPIAVERVGGDDPSGLHEQGALVGVEVPVIARQALEGHDPGALVELGVPADHVAVQAIDVGEDAHAVASRVVDLAGAAAGGTLALVLLVLVRRVTGAAALVASPVHRASPGLRALLVGIEQVLGIVAGLLEAVVAPHGENQFPAAPPVKPVSGTISA